MNTTNESLRIILVSPENSSEAKEEFSVRDKINYQLITELTDTVLSLPETIIQKLRQILYRNGFTLPEVNNLNTMGEELIIEIEQHEHRIHGEVLNGLYVYLIYYLMDDKSYDVFAEVIDENEVQEILNSVDDEDVEED